MSSTKKPYQLFEDLAIQQRAIKAKMESVSLEEARRIAKWLKQGKADKRTKPAQS